MADLASSDFQRAFAAMSYLVGRRDAELLEPLPAVHEGARAFARRLEHPERERRAEVLARELARLTASLEARALK
ncbi:MAG: hypothetical protein ABJB12_21195 [Pseudomonadota bacterium]